MGSKEVTVPQQHRSILRSGPAFAYPGDQLHPGFGRTDAGTHMAAYHDGDLANMIWTFSVDDGATYDPGVSMTLGGDYPSVKLWNGNRFYGTFVTDFNDLGGGPTYLFECTNPADSLTYNLVYWDWSTYGWHDMMDAAIACDNSQSDWEWGVSSYVTSTTYASSPYTNGPTIVYCDEQTNGSGWISWYNYNDCAHTDVAIDPITHYMYAVYDWFDGATWKLLVRVNDFANIETGFDTLYEITGAGNLRNPTVAAYNDNVVVLAQTDENTNDDIICFYSNDKFVTAQSSFVANSGANEQYPDVVYSADKIFYCTFVMNNNIYRSKTEDAGITWSATPWQVNEDNGAVIAEYKTSYMCEKAVMAMWEEQQTDADIYIGAVLQNNPPGAPTITGPASIKKKVSTNYKFNAVDPEGNDVSYFVDWGDGTTSDWTVYSASGIDVTISHTWAKKGDYTITAKAKDSFGLVGPTGTLAIKVPRTVSINPFFMRLLERFPHTFPILRYLLGV